MSLIGTPGTTYFTGLGSLPVRGMHDLNNVMYVVAGAFFYSITPGGTYSAALGTLNTSNGRVSMSDNGVTAAGLGGNQIIVVDGIGGYIYDVGTGVFSTISGGGWPSNTVHIAYLDGYFIVTCVGSMGAYCSNLFDGTTWNALAVAEISASSDPIQTVMEIKQQLVFIKNNTTEFWYDAGVSTATGFPFLRLSGGVIDGGTPSPWSVARMQNSLFMLGTVRNNESGEVMGISQLIGYQYQIVSPPAINYQIGRWGKYDDAFGYCYSSEGHNFYVLTSPSANQTFVYDVTTQMCHERSTYTNSPYAYGRHLSNCYCFFNNKHYVGDYMSGNIYEMRSDVFTDNLSPIISVRQSQHVNDKNTLNNFFIKRLIIDAETGVGPNATSLATYLTTDSGITLTTDAGVTLTPDNSLSISGQSANPMCYLSWSDDGGHVWSNDYQASMGAVGNYRTRLIWRRLGYSRDRVWRLAMSEPTKKIVIGAVIEASQ